DLGSALIGAELHDYGREYLTNYPIAVGKVDVDSAKKAASEILDPKDYVIVMVGDAKDLEPQLKKEGWRYQKVEFTEPITPLVDNPDAPVDPKDVVAAHKLVDDALVAKGGRAKIAAIKAFRMVQSGSTAVGKQEKPLTIDRIVV